MAEYDSGDYADEMSMTDTVDPADELSRTASTLALIDQMKREEMAAAAGQAPIAPPQAPRPMVAPPMGQQAPPMAQPTAMGQPVPAMPLTPPPPMSPAQNYQQAAQAGPGPGATAAWDQLVQSGQRSSPAAVYPPPAPPSGRPNTFRLPDVVQPPDVPSAGQQQFEAQQNIQRAIDRGMQPADAVARYAAGLFATGGARPMLPQKPVTPQSRNVGGVLYERNPTSGQWESVTQPKEIRTPVTAAVNNRYKSLIAEEMTAKQGDNPTLVRQTRDAREAFEKDHPELGLAPKTTMPGTSAPAITPPAGVAPAPRPNISAPKKITSQNEFDALPKGAIYIGSDGKRYRKP